MWCCRRAVASSVCACCSAECRCRCRCCCSRPQRPAQCWHPRDGFAAARLGRADHRLHLRRGAKSAARDKEQGVVAREGQCLCREQLAQPSASWQLRRLLSAPAPAPGCPKLRPASANQPRVPRWPAISGGVYTNLARSRRRRARWHSSTSAPRSRCASRATGRCAPRSSRSASSPSSCRRPAWRRASETRTSKRVRHTGLEPQASRPHTVCCTHTLEPCLGQTWRRPRGSRVRSRPRTPLLTSRRRTTAPTPPSSRARHPPQPTWMRPVRASQMHGTRWLRCRSSCEDRLLKPSHTPGTRTYSDTLTGDRPGRHTQNVRGVLDLIYD